MRPAVLFTRFYGSMFSTRSVPRAHAIAAGTIRPAQPQSWERQMLERLPDLSELLGIMDQATPKAEDCWEMLTCEDYGDGLPSKSRDLGPY